MRAVWNGEIIAQSNETIEIEGNQYFPPKTVKKEFLKESKMTSVCPWKGNAKYYDIVVNGETNKDAAWYYSEPKEEAKKIKDYVAFWKGVKIEE